MTLTLPGLQLGPFVAGGAALPDTRALYQHNQTDLEFLLAAPNRPGLPAPGQGPGQDASWAWSGPTAAKWDGPSFDA